ncbi:hypothetical protein CR155_06855 [Pollutimonas nitritireducens]|uniref:Copper-binding protein n=1 Tax=Pollutimonas nitritireducens TaxID=2045209 RepID=A0A2N4UHK0_9BURK|nr:copper-binding protein [Pollutimonas nitritireducens]PLC54489.1 hypothetical protein CR155_06855 [Pollutimonas nitritireducens]
MALANYRLQQALGGLFALTSFYSVSAVAQEANATGEVRRIDAASGKITIKHGEISELQLPAMTLVYRIDPALLKGIAPGDEVAFTARREDGHYVVTQISK